MWRWTSVLMVFLLAGCVGSPPREKPIARYDLGDPVGHWPQDGIVIRQIEVRAAHWFASPAQLYRLSHLSPQQRQSYAESRWVAPPAELIEHWLTRVILPGQPAGNANSGCRLVIWLDELEQRFTSAMLSEVVLMARAELMHRQRLLAAERLHVIRPAMTADSAGGARATREAVQELTEALIRWLEERRQREPELSRTCAGG